MSSYTPGWITLPNKKSATDDGVRWRDKDGNFSRLNPNNAVGYKGQPSADAYVGTALTGAVKAVGNFFNGTPSTMAERRGLTTKPSKAAKQTAVPGRNIQPGGGGFGPSDTRYVDPNTTNVPGRTTQAGGGGGFAPPRTSSASTATTKRTGAGPSNTETRTNAVGVTQTGRNTSRVMPGLDELSAFAGAPIQNFAGPSFPTQEGSNKITDGYKNTSANGYGLADDEVDSGKFTTIGGKKYAISQEAVQDQQDYGFKGPSMPASEGQVDSNDSFNGNMDENGLDDNDFGGPDPADYASSGEEMRRRSTFLDEPDSLLAMRKVKAGMGMSSVGTKNYANVNGEVKEIGSDEMRGILQAAPGKAQELKDAYVQRLQDATKETPSAPSEAQNPSAESGTAAFQGNSPLGKERYGEQLGGTPASVEFTNNNSQEIPGIQQSMPNKNRMAGQFNLNQNFFGK